MTNICCDYHIHSTFSCDAKDNIETICQAAIQRGLGEICFTEHVDLIPWDSTRGYFRPGDFVGEVERCRAQLAGQLSIRAGVEISEPHLVAQQTQELLSAWPFDFVLGSIHWTDESGICLSDIYKVKPPQDIEKDYLTWVVHMAEQGEFDSVGHLDLVRRYRPKELGPFDPLAYADLIRAALRAVAQRGKAIEINTSPLRRGLQATCPDLTVLRWYKELGGEKLTLGSDTHQAQDVGAGLDVAIELARAAGFARIVAFEQRQPRWIKLG